MTDEQRGKLKACPFRGCAMDIIETAEGGYQHHGDHKPTCPLEGNHSATWARRVDLVHDWNTRPAPDIAELLSNQCADCETIARLQGELAGVGVILAANLKRKQRLEKALADHDRNQPPAEPRQYNGQCEHGVPLGQRCEKCKGPKPTHTEPIEPMPEASLEEVKAALNRNKVDCKDRMIDHKPTCALCGKVGHVADMAELFMSALHGLVDGLPSMPGVHDCLVHLHPECLVDAGCESDPGILGLARHCTDELPAPVDDKPYLNGNRPQQGHIVVVEGVEIN